MKWKFEFKLWLTTLLLVLVQLLITGCRLSPSEAYELQNAENAQVARENLTKIFEALTPESQSGSCSPNSQAYAMDSAVKLVLEYKSKEQSPELYAQLVNILKSTVEKPSLTSRDSSNKNVAYLRAWALYCLGRLKDPNHVEFLISALTMELNARDKERQVEISALTSLSKQLEELRSSRRLREKFIQSLTGIKLKVIDVKDAALEKARSEISRLVKYFEGEFKSLPVLTDLLKTYVGNDPGEPILLQTLEWNYQVLNALVLSQSPNTELSKYESNIEILLVFSRDQRSAIAKRARIILLKFAPFSLFNELVTQTRKPTTEKLTLCNELATMLKPIETYLAHCRNSSPVNIYVTVNEVSRTPLINETKYVKRSSTQDISAEAIKNLLTIVRFVPPKQSEHIYSKLFEVAPRKLAEHFIAVVEGLLKNSVEGEPIKPLNLERGLQVGRYLNLIINDKRLREFKLIKETVSALAAMTGLPSTQIISFVSASIFKNYTLDVTLAAARTLPDLDEASNDVVRSRVTLYLRGLQRLEQVQGKQIYSTAPLQNAELKTPFGVLKFALSHNESDVKEFAAKFLNKRNPGKLVEHLNGLVRRSMSDTIDFRLIVMLGDTIRYKLTEVRPAALKSAISILGDCLKLVEEDHALIIARYLIEIGNTDCQSKLTAFRNSKYCKWKSLRIVIDSFSKENG